MKANRFKEVLAAGKVPVGHMIVEFNVRGIAKMLEGAGVDFVVVDMEHGTFDVREVADLVAWFKATPIAPFVRVPELTCSFIARALDTGALGVMVPNVKTASQAKAVVDAAKYRPVGRRGLTFASAVNDYKDVDACVYMDRANETTTVICQIESGEALEELDGIAATPGVDVLWVGQFDLTTSMGIPGAFGDRRFVEALRRVAAAAKRHRKAAAIQSSSVARLEEWSAMGFNVLSYQDDGSAYLEAMTRGVTEVRARAGRR